MATRLLADVEPVEGEPKGVDPPQHVPQPPLRQDPVPALVLPGPPRADPKRFFACSAFFACSIQNGFPALVLPGAPGGKRASIEPGFDRERERSPTPPAPPGACRVLEPLGSCARVGPGPRASRVVARHHPAYWAGRSRPSSVRSARSRFSSQVRGLHRMKDRRSLESSVNALNTVATSATSCGMPVVLPS